MGAPARKAVRESDLAVLSLGCTGSYTASMKRSTLAPAPRINEGEASQEQLWCDKDGWIRLEGLCTCQLSVAGPLEAVYPLCMPGIVQPGLTPNLDTMPQDHSPTNKLQTMPRTDTDTGLELRRKVWTSNL